MSGSFMSFYGLAYSVLGDSNFLCQREMRSNHPRWALCRVLPPVAEMEGDFRSMTYLQCCALLLLWPIITNKWSKVSHCAFSLRPTVSPPSETRDIICLPLQRKSNNITAAKTNSPSVCIVLLLPSEIPFLHPFPHQNGNWMKTAANLCSTRFLTIIIFFLLIYNAPTLGLRLLFEAFHKRPPDACATRKTTKSPTFCHSYNTDRQNRRTISHPSLSLYIHLSWQFWNAFPEPTWSSYARRILTACDPGHQRTVLL